MTILLASLAGAACGGDEQVPAPTPLAYERTVFTPGLNETVRIIKSPLRRVAVRADGTEQSVRQLWDDNRRAHRTRFGYFVRGFYEHGVTQDYYARYHDLVVVKAAGNDNCPEPVPDPEFEHVQEACPFTLNSICVGSVDANFDMSGFSSDENPGNSGFNNEFWQIDREEPDLVAYGGQEAPSNEFACVANPLAGSTAWSGQRGTSFAAPVITSMIALYRELCEPAYGRRLTEPEVRALLRTFAFGANPDGAAYSTPKPGQDFRDGGGFLFADALQA